MIIIIIIFFNELENKFEKNLIFFNYLRNKMRIAFLKNEKICIFLIILV